MARAKVTFERLIQDSQDYGSDDEHMVSRVFFSLEVEGKEHQGLYANIKQPVGSSFETAPLEISKPVGYQGPFNHAAFSAATERYYRALVGAAGRGIRIDGGNNIRMRNNTFVQPGTAEFEIKASGGPW
jgi:hypothetical protein